MQIDLLEAESHVIFSIYNGIFTTSLQDPCWLCVNVDCQTQTNGPHNFVLLGVYFFCHKQPCVPQKFLCLCDKFVAQGHVTEIHGVFSGKEACVRLSYKQTNNCSQMQYVQNPIGHLTLVNVSPHVPCSLLLEAQGVGVISKLRHTNYMNQVPWTMLRIRLCTDMLLHTKFETRVLNDPKMPPAKRKKNNE